MRFRFAWIALIAIVVGAVAIAQVPTTDQLNVLKNLPPDEQDALIQGVLGRGDGTGTKTDPKLRMPLTVQPKRDQLNESSGSLKKLQTSDGRTLRLPDEDPELRHDDTVLIDLTPLDAECVDLGANNLNGANAAAIAGNNLPTGSNVNRY